MAKKSAKKPDRKIFTVELPPDIYARLEKLADREDCSMGRLTRLAIDDYLQKQEKGVEPSAKS